MLENNICELNSFAGKMVRGSFCFRWQITVDDLFIAPALLIATNVTSKGDHFHFEQVIKKQARSFLFLAFLPLIKQLRIPEGLYYCRTELVKREWHASVSPMFDLIVLSRLLRHSSGVPITSG